MKLVLRRTVIAGQICDDDYVVFDHDVGIKVGRIMLTGFPGGHRWSWYLHAPHPFEQGIEDTLEAAKATFRAAWERRRSEVTTDKLVEIKDWLEGEGPQ